MINTLHFAESIGKGCAKMPALAARGPVVYSAVKGVVRSMSRTLAKRLGSSGVRVNTIHPASSSRK